MVERTADEIFPEAKEQVLSIPQVIVIEENKINSEGFIEEIEKFLSSGKHIWRSSGKLATHFKVDSVELDKLLSKHEKITSRANDNHEVFYALKSRLEQKQEKPRPIITEEDRYALAQISAAADLLQSALKRFGVLIHTKSPEAFNYFSEGKSKLDIGIMNFAVATKANLEKLD